MPSNTSMQSVVFFCFFGCCLFVVVVVVVVVVFWGGGAYLLLKIFRPSLEPTPRTVCALPTKFKTPISLPLISLSVETAAMHVVEPHLHMPTPSSRLSNPSSTCPHPVQGCRTPPLHAHTQFKAVEPHLCMPIKWLLWGRTAQVGQNSCKCYS